MGGGVGSQNDCGDHSCYCSKSIVSDDETDSLMCTPDVLLLEGITADFLCLLFCDKGRTIKQVDSKMGGIERLQAGGQVAGQLKMDYLIKTKGHSGWCSKAGTGSVVFW